MTPYGDLDLGNHVLTCCLVAPGHYLNQCWLTINGVQWHWINAVWHYPVSPNTDRLPVANMTYRHMKTPYFTIRIDLSHLTIRIKFLCKCIVIDKLFAAKVVIWLWSLLAHWLVSKVSVYWMLNARLQYNALEILLSLRKPLTYHAALLSMVP